jgi:hypothetical protein
MDRDGQSPRSIVYANTLFARWNRLQNCKDSQFLAWESRKPAEMKDSGEDLTLAMSAGILRA